MTTRATLTVALLAAFSSGSAAAQTGLLDRFQLFNECRPMALLVEGLSEDAAGIELTKERIRTIAEGRLRAARLYTAETQWPYLYVNINVVGPAFSFAVHYMKNLYDPLSDATLAVSTWRRGQTGTHGGNAGYILQGLSEHLDRFVLEYLRVNEATSD